MKIEDVGNSSFKCKLLLGNAKNVLQDIPENTFHMAVTSPPYWDQRDYNVDGQLGQENSPEEYVENLVAICREVRRVIREDGTFWLNIGDGYCKKTIKSSNLKQKDLVGIPWMVAFALRQDGWYLRSDIIWKKTNPMPESVRTRPSKSYEHLFLFSKSENYFYDAEAIAEPQKEISVKRAYSKNRVEKRKDYQNDNYAISGKSQDKTYRKMRKILDEMGEDEVITCNKKDVWEIATADNKVKHFAIYPRELVKPCILAGSSSKGCCPKCQSPWIMEKGKNWEPSCNCGETEVKECIVLDPFNGSGTTGMICREYGRKYVGIDISEEYLSYARDALIGERRAEMAEEVDSIQQLKVL
jgi:DNA modification methylase